MHSEREYGFERRGFGVEHDVVDLADENENHLLKIPMDVLIYEILSHYCQKINNKALKKLTEFSFFGYFESDPSRKIYFLFRNIAFEYSCPDCGFLKHENCPIMAFDKIERIKFLNYPFLHEFYELSVCWLNLRELVIAHNLPIKYDAFFSRKGSFPSLEKIRIVDNSVRLGIGRRGRRGILGRTSKDREKYCPLLPSYLQDVNEKLTDKNLTFDYSNFRSVKRLELDEYDEFILTTLSLIRSPPSEDFKNLEEIRITRSKGRFRISPLIKEKLTHLQLREIPSHGFLKWSKGDIFKNLKSLHLGSYYSTVKNTITISRTCFPLLEELIIAGVDFDRLRSSSFPPSLRHLSLTRCCGKVLLRDDLQLTRLEHLEIKEFSGDSNYNRHNRPKKSKYEDLVRCVFQLITNYQNLKTFIFRSSRISGSLIPWSLLCHGLERLEMSSILLKEEDFRTNNRREFTKMKHLDLLNVGWKEEEGETSSYRRRVFFGEFPNLEELRFLNNANSYFFRDDKESLPRRYGSFIRIGRNVRVKRNQYVDYSTAGCFDSEHSKVRIISQRAGEEKMMRDVKVGDFVETSASGKELFEKVVMVRHHTRRKYPVISINCGKVMTTPNHLVYVYSAETDTFKLIPAKKLLHYFNNERRDYSMLDRFNNLVEIKSIKLCEEERYVSNVYTKSGKIIVNGIQCSVYTSKLEKKLYRANLVSLTLLGKKKNQKLRNIVTSIF